jgi:hypothetical protein
LPKLSIRVAAEATVMVPILATGGLSTGSSILAQVSGGGITTGGVSVATVVSGTRTGMGSTVLTNVLEGSEP